MATLDYDGSILGIGGGIGEKQYDLGFNRATAPAPDRFYDETHRRLLRWRWTTSLINYSSQILDAPYYSAEDKEGPEGAVYRRDESSIPRQPSPAAMSGAPGPPTTAVQAARATRCSSMTPCSQSYNTVAVWVGDMVGVDYLYNFVHDTLECSYINAENDMDLGTSGAGLPEQRPDGGAAGRCLHDLQHRHLHHAALLHRESTDYQGNTVLDNNKYINTTQAISAETRRYIMNRMMCERPAQQQAVLPTA